MRQLAAITLAALLAITPAYAQDDTAPETEEGFSLMEEGAKMLMRGLLSEMEPAIDELRQGFEEFGPAFAQFAKEIGPAFAELLNTVDDIRYYGGPEFLSNGDIILRRLPDAPPFTPPAPDLLPEPDGEIDL